ncbi:transposase [Spirobacillus cienkowskii]|uniref:transposase n=1 Tax=Spirobacillus cienkowskii TaxID=495820 RepID=UPI003BAFA032
MREFWSQLLDCKLIELNSKDNHEHILVSILPKYFVAIVVIKLKLKSSYFFKKSFGNRLRKNYGEIIFVAQASPL